MHSNPCCQNNGISTKPPSHNNQPCWWHWLRIWYCTDTTHAFIYIQGGHLFFIRHREGLLVSPYWFLDWRLEWWGVTQKFSHHFITISLIVTLLTLLIVLKICWGCFLYYWWYRRQLYKIQSVSTLLLLLLLLMLLLLLLLSSLFFVDADWKNDLQVTTNCVDYYV